MVVDEDGGGENGSLEVFAMMEKSSVNEVGRRIITRIMEVHVYNK